MTDVYAKAGRAVAYYPKLALALDSIPAALFLCQFVYWYEKGASGDGYIYKTVEQIESETGLTYEQQKRARELLKNEKLITEYNDKVKHRQYYRVELERLAWLWRFIEEHSESNGVPLRKARAHRLKQQAEEQRAEKAAQAVEMVRPFALPEPVWREQEQSSEPAEPTEEQRAERTARVAEMVSSLANSTK
jgi:hypothetical protein